MFIVENLDNGSSYTAPEWADTAEKAMLAGAAAVGVARGNISLKGTPKRFTLTDSTGKTQDYRVVDPIDPPYSSPRLHHDNSYKG